MSRADLRMWRRPLLILALGLAQSVLTLGLAAITYAAGMARFDSGAPPGLVERLASGTVEVLMFPLVQLVLRLWPGPRGPHSFPGEHLIFLANGVLWAIVAVWVTGYWRHRRASGRAGA